MYPTYSAHQVSSVTELRQDTSGLLDHVETTGETILIQRNNEPIAVLLGIETYKQYLTLQEKVKCYAAPDTDMGRG